MMHTHTHSHVRRAHTRTHTHTHTRSHTHTFTHTRSHIHTHALAHTQRKVAQFERDLRKAEDTIFQLRQENQKQREKIGELRANRAQGGSNSGQPGAEVHRLTLERRQLLKEKAALEQQVAQLRQAM